METVDSHQLCPPSPGPVGGTAAAAAAARCLRFVFLRRCHVPPGRAPSPCGTAFERHNDTHLPVTIYIVRDEIHCIDASPAHRRRDTWTIKFTCLVMRSSKFIVAVVEAAAGSATQKITMPRVSGPATLGCCRCCVTLGNKHFPS